MGSGHRILLLIVGLVMGLAACDRPPDPAPTEVIAPTSAGAPTPDDPPPVTQDDTPAAAESPVLMPPFERLEPGWNVLLPGGDTTCALGDPYGFYIRPGNPERLLVYLQDGGACWNELICRPGETATYDPNVSSQDNPARSPYGIFQVDNPANPFREYSMVFVPNCTADALLGNRTLTYEGAAGGSVTIRHMGAENVAAVFGWLAENIDAPESVFVAGSGTGALASPLYAGELAHIYPDAQVTQLADSAGGFRSDEGELEAILRGWRTNEPETQASDLAAQVAASGHSPAAFYVVSHERYPGIRFHQINSAADEMQVFYTRLAGASGKLLLERLDANETEITAGVEEYASFTAGGELSRLLWRPEFYMLQADNVPLWLWVTQIATGEPVESVRCADC